MASYNNRTKDTLKLSLKKLSLKMNEKLQKNIEIFKVIIKSEF